MTIGVGDFKTKILQEYLYQQRKNSCTSTWTKKPRKHGTLRKIMSLQTDPLHTIAFKRN